MYYKEDGKTIDPRWVDSEALSVARKLVVKNIDGNIDKKNSINTSQLRKFYADIKRIEWTWQVQRRSDEYFFYILPQIKMLKAKVAYARGRNLVLPVFEKWINKHIDAISSPDDFRAFLLHFEAVVGFCYGEGLKD